MPTLSRITAGNTLDPHGMMMMMMRKMTVVMMMMMMVMMMMMTTVMAVPKGGELKETAALRHGYRKSCMPDSKVRIGDPITVMPALDPFNTTNLTINGTHLREFPRETFTSLSCLRTLMIVKNAKLLRIPGYAFANLPLLKTIVISENRVLETIGPYAFDNLSALHEMTISNNAKLLRIPGYAFANLTSLKTIVISENRVLETIGPYAFYNLAALHKIIITNSKYLKSIDKSAFVGLRRLKYLTISNTGLEIFPDFNRIQSAEYEFLLELEQNIHLKRVPGNAFRGLCTQTIEEIRLPRNGIKEVASDAFNGTQMLRLYLTDNDKLAIIDRDAFKGSSGLITLDVSGTAVSSLPEFIFGGLKTLIAKNAHALKKLPLERFTRLSQANLTYFWHCCAFRDISPNSSKLCEGVRGEPHQHSIFKNRCAGSTCSPMPDPFNLCEDIMAATPLRVLIWIISILALLGNGAVLLVLLGSRAKMTVPRFLMCHLAFADLCMGIYLVVIATVDTLTRGHYHNYSSDWQTGHGCSAAGFFTVFASELSVFTLTAITLERWHTITHAMRLDRKLRLRHACAVMSGGWVFAFISALLPTMGISSYGKVSICLPMDVETTRAQVYVVSLLLLNVLAFLVVCACYLSIYLTVRNSSLPAHATADTDVARRMAVLIFTDFLCMAPISFFAISAALKLPLITVFEAKVLLVLFYPINAFANPFLYAFFTHTFRRDFFLLTSRFGLFKAQAQIYRTESSSCQQPAWTSPKSSGGHHHHHHGTSLYSLANVGQRPTTALPGPL